MSTYTGPARTVEAADWFGLATNMVTNVEDLLKAAAIAVVIFAIVKTYAKSQALIPTVVAMIIGGVVIWSIANTTWFSSTAGNTITNNAVRSPHAITSTDTGAAGRSV